MKKLTTPEGRLVWVNLEKQSGPPDGKKTYNTTLIFPGDADISGLKTAIEEVACEEFGKDKVAAMFKAGKFKHPLKSNTLSVNDKGERRKGFEDDDGHFITFKTDEKDRLCLVDGRGERIDEELVKSGYYACVSANIKAFDVSGSKGVTCYLGGIQVRRKGESLESASTSVDDFAVDESAEDLSDTLPVATNDSPFG